MKYLLIPILAVLLIGFGSVFGEEHRHITSSTNNIIPDKIDWSKCTPKCYQVIPTHATENGGYAYEIDLSRNMFFDIVMPDGAKKQGVILVPHDYILMQNNVVIAWLGNFVPTNASQNIDYCELAQWTWDHQDSKFKAKYNMTLVVPEYCLHGHIPAIPEFNIMVYVIFTIVMITSLMFSRVK